MDIATLRDCMSHFGMMPQEHESNTQVNRSTADHENQLRE